MNRKGFTLAELLMGISVMAILGVALTRILINDSRFVSRQDAMLSSRQGARAALNSVVSELSMVADSAVIAATRDSITVRVPVAAGLTCQSPTGSSKIVSLMPVDSVIWATTAASTPGIAWRQSSGIYTRVTGGGGITIAIAPAGDSSYCHADSVRLIPGGKLLQITGIPGAQMPADLAVLRVYIRVTYKFAPSTDLPGRVGLWRQASGGVAEELVTPFDTSARFAYLIGGPKAATMTLRTATVTGAGLDSIRGVELHLYASSESKPQGLATFPMFPLKTRVRFSNKVS
jgi:prepilin-type N-terminal cleavage/methylation domain-containing protein